MKLEELKKAVDIFFLIEMNHNFKRINYKNYCHLNPCPKCGGNDHFTVYPETNSYSSFAECCGSGSVVDFLIEVEGMNQSEAIQELKRIVGVPLESHSVPVPYQNNQRLQQSPQQSIQQQNKNKAVSVPAPTSTKKNFKNLYQSLSQDQYFLNRGLSKKIIEKYSLGAVSDQTDLSSFTDKEKIILKRYNRFVIPVTDDYFIARLDETKVEEGLKYINFGNAELLNKHYINDAPKTFIFVTEGSIDALTIETLGFDAIALNSASNGSLLVKEIQRHEEKARQQQFILLADNDKAGRKLEEKLQKSFKDMNMTIYVHKWYEPFHSVKDINELAINSPDQAAELLQTALDQCINGHSAFNSLIDLFMDMKPIHPIQITEFPRLNEIIGGLRTGLYTVGAASSLGKTTFIQEIADNVASQGEHVLFFSLEMSKKELIAKSLVRTMGELKRISKKKGEITYTRDLLSGNIKDNGILMSSVGLYEKTAKNLFIYEGMFDMNVHNIRQEVEKHIQLHHKKPLVIVDYLQVLQPLSDRMSEKQATDKNVTELKRITRDLDTPLIVISSFNRDAYNREASFSAFKESGAIEYGSDVVLALELQKVKELEKTTDGKVKDSTALDKAKGSLVRDITLKVLKNRFGKAFEEIEYSYVTNMNKFNEKDGRDSGGAIKTKRI